MTELCWGVLEPDRDLVPALGPVPDADGLGGRLVLDEMARRELGPVLEIADRECQRALVDRPQVETVDPVEPLRPDGNDHAIDGGGVWRSARVDQRTATEQEGGGARQRDDRHEHEREQVPGAAIHDSVARGGDGVQLAAAPAAIEPVPVLPGAWIGVPSAQRGQVAGPGS